MRFHGRRKYPIFAFLFLLLAMPFCSAASGDGEPQNLLCNGDFETLDTDGFPADWAADAYRMDPGFTLYTVSEGMDGPESHAATIQNTTLNDARFSQTVQVEPETMYCLSGYIRAENISGGHGANLSIEGVYAFSEKLYNTDNGWVYIEYYGETGPEQYEITVFARVGGYSGESKGKASFDHLCLKKTDRLPEGVYADLWFVQSDSAESDDDELDWGDADNSDADSASSRPALLLIGVFYSLIVLAVIYYFREGGNSSSRNLSDRDDFRPAPLLFLAFGLRLILSYFITGYSVDVNCFTSWGYTMARTGPAGFYQSTSFCDYPPLYMYVLGFNSWLAGIFHADAGWTRVIFRFIPSLCDVAACWILLHYPKKQFTRSFSYRLIVLLLAFNPVTVLNSAAWGQMDSVLCLLILCVALFVLDGKWIPAIAFYVTAVLVKPQALMLGILGLAIMVLAILQNKKMLKKILIALLCGVILIAVYVVPFGIYQNAGWLIGKYTDTLSSYPYATVNTANLYYLAGGNWSPIGSAAKIAAPIILSVLCLAHGMIRYLRNRSARLILAETATALLFSAWFAACAVLKTGWLYTGAAAMVYAFVIVLAMAVRKKDIGFLPYLGALLFILLYVFGIKMHERYLFPAFLLLMLAWAHHQDRRILRLLLLFSLTTFLNEGIVLDNSIRLGSSMGHLNADTVILADILSALNVTGAVYAVWLGYELMKDIPAGMVHSIPGIFPVRTAEKRRSPEDYHPDHRLHWSRKDTLILCCIMLCYSALSLSTLGSTKAPQTAWSSSGEEEQIVFDLGSWQEDIRILYFGQVSRYDFSVAQSEDGVIWSGETYAQMDQGQCWKWKYVTQSFDFGSGERKYYNNPENIVHFSGRYIRITSCQVGLVLNEILFRNASGELIQAKISAWSGSNPDSQLYADPENLLDEQDAMENLPGFFGMPQEGETQPSWWNSTYFDEIYHARTGFEFMNGTVPYETSHPPLGKVLISWSIMIFGMTPFGWRFSGALAGILMLPGMYLLGKQLTKRTWAGALSCLILALDCMHLTQTQIATIDSYPVLFIIFAFFFMLRFMQTDLTRCSLRVPLISLFFSGLSMGLAIASKWIGIYAGAGLACLYFWHCFRQISVSRRRNAPDEAEPYRRVFILSSWCILFFIVIPIMIYLLSYIPYFAYNTRIRSLPDYLEAVWRSQESMLSYHSTPRLGMDHPFYSPWWQWPIIGKPMFYATEQYIPSGSSLHHSIFSFGNPGVWWAALGTLPAVLFLWLRGKRYRVGTESQRWHLTGQSFDIRYEFVLIGFLAQYLPWVLVPRGTYIYHYFASVPFLILSIVFCLTGDFYPCKGTGRFLKAFNVVYISIILVLFIILLPYSTGMAAPSWWLDIGKNILQIWY